MAQQLPSEAQAYQRAHLEELASRPNTVVYEPVHDRVAEPWKVASLRPLCERLVARVLGFAADTDHFVVAKTCLDDAEVLEFQRAHPKMYWMMTDRALMAERKYRDAITGLLFVREEVERGAVAEGNDADAMATKAVVAALK